MNVYSMWYHLEAVRSCCSACPAKPRQFAQSLLLLENDLVDEMCVLSVEVLGFLPHPVNLA